MLERVEIAAKVKALNRYIRENNLSDFRIERLEKGVLYLAGSFDLSYYHDIEIEITGMERLALCSYFYVDLSAQEPFSVYFPAEDTAVFTFEDCSIRQRGEIWFSGSFDFQAKHVEYGFRKTSP